MTIEEAIVKLEQTKHWYESLNAADEAQAAQLGIEALKKVQRDRELWRVPPLLPGETEESP